MSYKRMLGSLFGKARNNARTEGNNVPNQQLDPLSAAMLARKSQNKLQQPQQAPTMGDLAGSSIFSEEPTTAPQSAGEQTPEQNAKSARKARFNPQLSNAALDPQPKARKRWLVRMIRQNVRDQGKLSKETVLRRTEREYLARSQWIQTSIKKLYPLARQIQGKSVEEALTQLRFSPKMVAREVHRHLVAVAEEAVAVKGMGLGNNDKKSEVSAKKPVEVVDYHGKKKLVIDPTALYIHRAFVNRGPYGKLPDHRARGRLYIMKPPYTSISIELKEEKTRIRITKEREEREARRKPWTHHPDRPIVQQRQYVLW